MKSWGEVADSPAFTDLTINQQEQARQQYFNQVVAPKVPVAEVSQARAQFDLQTRDTGVDDLVAAITKFESGGKANGPDSPQGARGSMQIMRDTFAQYARPGEDYNNDEHRRVVATRKIADDYNNYGGDIAQTAAAYIGGRGAVRDDGSIRNDVVDALGTSPAAYAAKIQAHIDAMTEASEPVFDRTFRNPQLPLPAGVAPSIAGAGRGSINPEITFEPAHPARDIASANRLASAARIEAEQTAPVDVGSSILDKPSLTAVAPGPIGTTFPMRQDFIDNFRTEVLGNVKPEDRMTVLKAMATTPGVYGQAAKSLIAASEIENKGASDNAAAAAAMIAGAPVSVPAQYQPIINGARAARELPAPAVPIPDMRPSFGDYLNQTKPADIAERQTLAMDIGRSNGALARAQQDGALALDDNDREAAKTEVGSLASLGRGWGESEAKLAKYTALAVSAIPVMAEALINQVKTAAGGKADTAWQDAAFRNLVDPAQNAVDWYAIKSTEKQRLVGKISGAVGGLLADLPLIIASGGLTAPELGVIKAAPGTMEYVQGLLSAGATAMRPLAIKAGGEKAEQVLNAGGSVAQATSSALTAGMMTLAMGALPMSMGGAEGRVMASVLPKAVSGAGIGMLTGEINREIQNAADPLSVQTPLSLDSALVSAATGSILGQMPHPARFKSDPAGIIAARRAGVSETEILANQPASAATPAAAAPADTGFTLTGARPFTEAKPADVAAPVVDASTQARIDQLNATIQRANAVTQAENDSRLAAGETEQAPLHPILKPFGGQETPAVTSLRQQADAAGIPLVLIGEEGGVPGQARVHGVMHDGALFVNPNSPKAAAVIAGHELGHYLEEEGKNPDSEHAGVYADLHGFLAPLIGQRSISQKIQTYYGTGAFEAASPADQARMVAHVTKEAVNDVIGNRAGETSFWSLIATRDKPLFTRIAQAFKELLFSKQAKAVDESMYDIGLKPGASLEIINQRIDAVMTKYLGEKSVAKMNEQARAKVEFDAGAVVAEVAPLEVPVHEVPAGAVDPKGAQVTYLKGGVVEVPVADLGLSKDVPQFKSDADANGVTQGSKLEGKYDRALAAPIQVWQRLNGALEVISGRHRLDLAQRSGEDTIPAQVHREADGFTAGDARVLDISLNVKDGRGKVKDYVNYFQEFKPTREAARSSGLLNTAIGRQAYAIADHGSDGTIAAHRADAITDEAAAQIAANAPKNEALQNLGLRYVLDGKSINFAVNVMRSARAAGFEGGGESGDMFGFDDSFAKEAEAVSREATKQQTSARQQLSAIRGASKRPELAAKGGVTVNDPAATQAKITELEQKVARLEGFATNPEVYRQLRADAGLANVPEAPHLDLETQTHEGLRSLAQDQAQIATADRAEQTRLGNKAEADANLGEFTLTGSDRAADVAEAAGQQPMFSLSDREARDEDYGASDNRVMSVVGGKPGVFDWHFATGGEVPPYQAPTQFEPRLDKIGQAVHKIFKSSGFKALARDAFGIDNLEVTPLHGSWKTNPEPSFALHAEGMTFEQASALTKMVGMGTSQEMALAYQPHFGETPGETTVAYIGADKKLTPGQLQKIFRLSQEAGIDYSTTLDGKGIKYLHLDGDAAGLIALSDKVEAIKEAVGLPIQDVIFARSTAHYAKDFIKSGGDGDHGAAWLQGSATDPSGLFRRTVDHLVVPYAKAVGAEGYRFSVQRFGERFGLSEEQRQVIQDALYPKSGLEKSTVAIATGKERLDVVPTGHRGTTTVSDILFALQNRSAHKGLIEPGDYSDRALKVISQAITDEVSHHINNPKGGKTAIGWYDTALKFAKSQYAKIYPEIATNKDAAMLFDAAWGITSQGNDVFSNSIYGARVYQMVRNGGMSLRQAAGHLKGTFGGETVAIENNLNKLHDMLEQNGYDKLRRVMNTKGTVSELNKMFKADRDLWFKGAPLRSKGQADQVISGWMVFGPKIGSFINNLHGDYSTLTADLWFSRSWNRILGYSFVHAPALEAEQYSKFVRALQSEHDHAHGAMGPFGKLKPGKSGEYKAPQFGSDAQDMSPEMVQDVVADPHVALRVAAELEELFRKGGYKGKSDLRRAAKVWIEARNESVAAPRTDLERSFQQKAAEEVQRMVKRKTGKLVTIADIQAALWFYEKDDLFTPLGGTNKKSEGADYAGAAKELLLMHERGNLFVKQDGDIVSGTRGHYLEGFDADKINDARNLQRRFEQDPAFAATGLKLKDDGRQAVITGNKEIEKDHAAAVRAVGRLVELANERGLGLDIKPSLHKSNAKDRLVAAYEDLGFQAKQDGTYSLAPKAAEASGKEANFSLADARSRQEDTPEFKRWYGSWDEQNSNGAAGVARSGRATLVMGRSSAELAVQRAGGVAQGAGASGADGEIKFTGTAGPVGRDGRPVIFFHGTREDIDAFDLNHPNRKDRGWLGRGVYAASDPVMADIYAMQKKGPTGPSMMPLYMAVKNPYVASIKEKQQLRWSSQAQIDRFTQSLKDEGHDGVVLESHEGHVELVAFEPSQVKSAVGNNGDFNPADSRINFSLADERKRTPLGFYSALGHGIDTIKASAAPAAGWRDAIKGLVNKGLVKADEVEWSGVTDWLDLQKGRVTKDQVADYLKQGGVKVEETMLGDGSKWSVVDQKTGGDGLLEYFDSEEEANRRVEELGPREYAVLQGAPSGFGETKYGKYQLKGGTNYREVLLTLPAASDVRESRIARVNDEYNAFADPLIEKYGPQQNWPVADQAKFREIEARHDAIADAPRGSDFKSGHWDQPNVLAHIRLNDRVDADGNKVLLVEELQSDWGQAGKKEGFRDAAKPWELFDPKTAEVVARFATKEEAAAALAESDPAKHLDYDDAPDKLPAAPFVNNTQGWLNLALKRVIVMAAEGGYDKVAFVNGEQSAGRYDLSKEVNSIEWNALRDGSRVVSIVPIKGNDIEFRVQPDGQTASISGRDSGDEFSGKRLDQVVGKETAEKIMAGAYGHLSGDGLKVGGKGMEAFYDQIVPNAVKALLKKMGGGTLEAVDLAGTKDASIEAQLASRRDELGELLVNGQATPEQKRELMGLNDRLNRIRASEVANTPNRIGQQPGFDITPEMRDKVEGGLPMFSLADKRNPQEKTEKFKRWFGDWDAAAKAEILNGPPVATLMSTDAPQGGYVEVAKWAAGIFKQQGGKAVREGLGDVLLDERAARSSLAHGGANKYKKVAFAAVKDVIERGALVHESQSGQEDSFYFSAPVDIDGRINIETVLVHRDPNTRRMYLHSVSTKENLLNQRVSSADAEASEQSGSTSSGEVASVIHGHLVFSPMAVSKVVDADGRPLVVYHVTGADVDAFRTQGGRTSTDDRLDASFFTDSADYAQEYAAAKRGQPVRTIAAYLAMRNPLEVKADPKGFSDPRYEQPIIEKARADGYDGVIFHDEATGSRFYAVFSPEQIKSAIGNNGDFNPADPRINFSLADRIRDFRESSLLRELTMFAAPMSTGSVDAQATAQRFANALRKADVQWEKINSMLLSRFTPDDRRAMWNAADEQNVLMTQSQPTSGRGIDALPPEQRRVMIELHTYANELWSRAQDSGMVEGDGLPFWTPRMAVLVGEDGDFQRPGGEGAKADINGDARNVSTTASSLKQRKYTFASDTEAAMKTKLGEGAELVRDILTMPMAMARLEKAIAGRELVNQIKQLGLVTGKDIISDTVKEGFESISHPAFVTYRPEFIEDANGKMIVREDQDGNPVMVKTPMLISADWIGPLKAVMSRQSGVIYRAYMLLKSKEMATIMLSPLAHNMTIFGRALAYSPTALLTGMAYFKGNALAKDNALLSRAIDYGLVPMGANRNSMIDITDVARGIGRVGGWGDPNESWISKSASALGNLFKPGVGDSIKAKMDAVGTFWHHDLLWKQVGALQIYIFNDHYNHLIAKGLLPEAAGPLAAHLANRYAGAVASENMSEMLRKTLNVLLFSRSFNVGNIGQVKDAAFAIPAGLDAMMRSDLSKHFGGDLTQTNAAMKQAMKAGRGKAQMGLVADLGMSMVLTAITAAAVQTLYQSQTVQDVKDGYVRRLAVMFGQIKGHPFSPSSYNPYQILPTWENEPDKRERIDLGVDENGRHQYLRLPTGKVVEDLIGWLMHAPETFVKKMSPTAKAVAQAITNDKGFGVPIEDPEGGTLKHIIEGLGHVIKAQIPYDTMKTIWDVAHGVGTPIDKAKLVGFATGVSTSQGNPHGSEAAVVYREADRVVAQRKYMMEAVKNDIKYGDYDKAAARLQTLGLKPSEINHIIRGLIQPKMGITPAQRKQFNARSNEDEQLMMENARR